MDRDRWLYQWVIVRDNCDVFVWWAATREEALDEFHRRGYHDEWRVLKKAKMNHGAER